MTAPAPDPALAALVAKIAAARGLRCEAYKESCLRRRLAVRMRARGVHTFDQYAAVLEADGGEYERLLDALTINVTRFFRNRDTWDVLAEQYLPGLWERTHGRVRCWSAGCASGEEPYTAAILLLEQARRAGSPGPLRAALDASDIDRASLERAARGCYREAAFEEMPPELLAAYVERPAGCVTPAVRAAVRFHHHDLTRDAPPAPPYDLVLCRNVAIYFDRPMQERLFLAFAEGLRSGGILVLGKVETLFGDARRLLELANPRERIYRRK